MTWLAAFTTGTVATRLRTPCVRCPPIAVGPGAARLWKPLSERPVMASQLLAPLTRVPVSAQEAYASRLATKFWAVACAPAGVGPSKASARLGQFSAVYA